MKVEAYKLSSHETDAGESYLNQPETHSKIKETLGHVRRPGRAERHEGVQLESLHTGVGTLPGIKMRIGEEKNPTLLQSDEHG